MSKKFKQLLVPGGYRHYWSKYPEGYTILEALLNWVDSVNQLTDNVNDWNIYLDDFVENFDEKLAPTVREMLNEMEQDGRLATIINEHIFEDLNNKIEQKVDKNHIPLNIMDFEEMKDGDDWKPAIDYALSQSKHVYFPKGHYKTSTVHLDSNTNIYGDGEDLTVFEPIDNRLFDITGTVEQEVSLTSDVEPFSKFIHLNNTGNIQPSDIIVLKSQRDALDENDAGHEYTMGTKTGNFTAYLGEFKRVGKVFQNYIELDSDTVFPIYKQHGNDETSEFKRNGTTVQKVNFKENITLKGFSITHIVNSTIHVDYGYNVNIENVKLIDDQYDGTVWRVVFINFINSFKCEAKRCYFEFKHRVLPEQYFWGNIFIISSSQECGLDACTSIRGSQSVDITFNRDGVISMNCYLKNSRLLDSNSSGITTHGGCYQTEISGNTVIGSQQGIYNRSRSTIIANNVIKGQSVAGDNFNNGGIRIYDKWAVDCVITGNTVINFMQCVSIQDSASNPFEHVNLSITGNTFKDFQYGVSVRSLWGVESYIIKGIQITNNVFTATPLDDNTVYGVHMRRRNRGINISNNTFTMHGESTEDFGIYMQQDCHDINIRDNFFKGWDTDILFPDKGAFSTDFGVNHLNVNETGNISQNVAKSNITNDGTSYTEGRLYVGTVSNSDVYERFSIYPTEIGYGVKIEDSVVTLDSGYYTINNLTTLSTSAEGRLILRVVMNGSDLITSYSSGINSNSLNYTFKANEGDTLEFEYRYLDSEPATMFASSQNKFSLIKIPL